MTLADLVGTHLLDARGEYIGKRINAASYESDSRAVVLFRLDGIVYAVEEDPDDGYRSSMREIRIALNSDIPFDALASFAPIAVECRLKGGQSDVLYMVNERTGLVIFEIGTDDIDDHYPSFVGRWTPEGYTPHWLSPGAP